VKFSIVVCFRPDERGLSKEFIRTISIGLAESRVVQMMTAKMKASIHDECEDLIRGAAGGLIFGAPLLYTTEMWLRGMHLSPLHLIGVVAFISIINIGFSYASGLRAHNKDHSFPGAIADAVTALALGVVVATIILYLIGQLNSGDSPDVVLGKIVIEACAVSLGVTFTNTKFPRHRGKKKPIGYKELEKAPLSDEQKQARLDFYNMAAVVGGAVIFSFNVAPTEEVIAIATSQSAASLLLLALFQFLVCYIILYAADFKEGVVFKRTAMQSPAAEIIMTVALAWVVSAVMLALIGAQDAKLSFDVFIASVLTLGFPAVIGGAAGKVIV
jgi:putative integral membrane protein (TIGR02587 family)